MHVQQLGLEESCEEGVLALATVLFLYLEENLSVQVVLLDLLLADQLLLDGLNSRIVRQ